MILYNIHSLHCPAAVGIQQSYEIARRPQSIPHERNGSLPGQSAAETHINIQNIFIIINKLSRKVHYAATFLHSVICEMRVSHSTVNEYPCVLGYDVMLHGKYLLIFQRELLPSSAGLATIYKST